MHRRGKYIERSVVSVVNSLTNVSAGSLSQRISLGFVGMGPKPKDVACPETPSHQHHRQAGWNTWKYSRRVSDYLGLDEGHGKET